MYVDQIILNAVAIVAVGTLFGLLTGDDAPERVALSLGAIWTLFCFSMVGWIIFVAVHFIGKYW